MWDFFWLPEGEQPTRNWRFTLHLSYHFWIWRWVNNLELILPPYVTFLQTRTVTSSSLYSTHTPPSESVVLFSLKTHILCSYSLMLRHLSHLWSVHECLLNIQVMKLWCQTQTLHLLYSHRDTRSHSGFCRAAVIPLTEWRTLPTHDASLVTRSCQSVSRHQYSTQLMTWMKNNIILWRGRNTLGCSPLPNWAFLDMHRLIRPKHEWFWFRGWKYV